MSKNKIPRAEGILLLITLIWGSTFVIVKGALVHVSPLLFQGVRFALAALLVGIYTFPDIRKTTRRTLLQGVFLGIGLGIGFGFQTIGLGLTTASKSGFITGLLVVFTPVFQLVIERRKPTRGNVAGVALVALGLFFLTTPQEGAFNAGDLLTLLCAIIFAVYIVYLDSFTREGFPREIVFYQMLVTSLMGFLFSPLIETPRMDPVPSLLTGIIYTAVFASAIATFLQSKYQRQSTPTRSAVIYSMEPVFAALLAVIVLHESFTLVSAGGGALIVLGLLISELA